MTEVYVDVAAASIGGGALGVAAAAETSEEARTAAADPEAVRALRYLGEAGVRVILVAPDALQPATELRDVATDIVRAVPPRTGVPAFYLTSEIARCQGSSARLRTVLIGGTPPVGSVRRCDSVARDVQAAAMEILAAEAMAPARTGS